MRGLAFWSGYLSRLGSSAWQHPFHALTALAWLLLLIAQSLLIDRRDRSGHRWLGGAMLGMVPLFCAAGFLVVQTMQRRPDVSAPPWATGTNPSSIAATRGCMAATLLEWAGYYLAPAVPAWAAFGVAVALAPAWLVGAAGFGVGAAAMWRGWTGPIAGRAVSRSTVWLGVEAPRRFTRG